MGAFAGAAQTISDRMHQQHLLDYQQNYLQNQALASEFGRMAEDPRTLPHYRGLFRQQQMDAIMEQPGKLHKPKIPLADLLKQQEQERIRINQTDPHNLPAGLISPHALQGISPPPAAQPSGGQGLDQLTGQAPTQNNGAPGGGQIQPPPDPAAMANAAIQTQNQIATQPGQVGTQTSGIAGGGFGNPVSAGAGTTPPPTGIQPLILPPQATPSGSNSAMRPAHLIAAESVGQEPPWSEPGTWEESPQHALWKELYSKAFTNEEQRQSQLRSQEDLFAFKRAENKRFIEDMRAKGVGHFKWKMLGNGEISGEPDMGTRTPGYVIGKHITDIDPEAQAISGGKKAPLEPFQLYHERTFEDGKAEYHPADIKAKYQYELRNGEPITVAYNPVSGEKMGELPGHPVIPGLLPVTSTGQKWVEYTGTDGLPHSALIPVTTQRVKGGITAPPGMQSPGSVPITAPPPANGASGTSAAPAMANPPGIPSPVGAGPGLPRGSRDFGVSPSQNKITRAATQKAYTPALESAERFNIMTNNYLDAVKNNDQQAMLSMLAQHLGMTMGTIRGNRMNQAMINEAEKSRPWLQGIASKVDSDGYLTGVTLTQPQMHQMLTLGRERLVQDLVKAKSEAGFMGAPGGGPPIVPNRSTMHFYMALAKGDAAKAKSMASEDGWSVK